MKISPKQIAIVILCVIIALIPTYIAITYYLIEGNSLDVNYRVTVADNNGKFLSLTDEESIDVAEAVIRMNKKLYAAGNLAITSLGEKYYTITIESEGHSASYKYYFSTNKDEKTIVRDAEGRYYYLDYNDAKKFLSLPCAHVFYESSVPPALSIFGGSDIMPHEGEWKFKNVSGSSAKVELELTRDDITYSMNSSTKLSFSISPDKCTVKLTDSSGNLIGNYSSLGSIPYERLDSEGLCFEIYAEWSDSKDAYGYAKYKFYSTVGEAPKFSINKTIEESGGFFIISVTNVSAPSKIEFSSTPSINYNPYFFSVNENAYAFIPIDKDLNAPETYTFNLAYGETVYSVNVNVTQRNILERDYDNPQIHRTVAAIEEYRGLLSSVGGNCDADFFTEEKFLDYDTVFSDDIAGIRLGFGHKRRPSNGDAEFRLDGVDYYMEKGTNVTAIGSGKVVYVGEAALLGKFVVIDHGMGLKTWYCTLSEAKCDVGATVKKGDVIGVSGSTGYTNANGVYLITTLKNVPICPYFLQEKGVTFN